jgi:hypothetical protein
VAPIDVSRVRRELARIQRTRKTNEKGKLVERLAGYIFGHIPGLVLDDQNVVNAYQSEEIDLVFWNDQLSDGLRFLDCPLIIECKGWSEPVPGRELRYFASVLKDRGRRNGILVALSGITGAEGDLTAGFYHQAAAMIDGVLVLVVTGEELRATSHSSDLVRLLKRKILQLSTRQLQAFKNG